MIDYYTTNVVVSAQDYTPFGMLMTGRKFSAGNGYRYGFNGKENDNEVKGEGAQQDYGMRIYDPRLGKFLSVDPIASNFPWNSPYSYAEGDPINYIDLDGLEKPNETAQATIGTATRTSQSVITNQTTKQLPKLAVDQTGKLVTQEVAKKAGDHWLLRGVKVFSSKAVGLTFTFILSDAGLASGELKPETKARIQLNSRTALLPTPDPKYDPKQKPEPEGKEEGYYIYETLRDNKQNAGIVSKGIELPYFGITGDAFSGGRYSPLSIEGSSLKQIIGKTNYYTAKGVETALIKLNKEGFETVRLSTRVDNDRVSTVNPGRELAGVLWLNSNFPNWKKDFLRPTNAPGKNSK